MENKNIYYIIVTDETGEDFSFCQNKKHLFHFTEARLVISGIYYGTLIREVKFSSGFNKNLKCYTDGFYIDNLNGVEFGEPHRWDDPNTYDLLASQGTNVPYYTPEIISWMVNNHSTKLSRETVTILIDHFVKNILPNFVSKIDVPAFLENLLAIACQKNRAQLVQDIICNPKWNQKISASGLQIALNKTCRYGSGDGCYEIIKMLVEIAKVDLTAEDYKAPMLAIFYKNYSAISYLMSCEKMPPGEKIVEYEQKWTPKPYNLQFENTFENP